MNISESIFNKLTDEQKKKVESAESADELLAIAKEYGQELTGDQLESTAAGGWLCDLMPCCSYEKDYRHQSDRIPPAE